MFPALCGLIIDPLIKTRTHTSTLSVSVTNCPLVLAMYCRPSCSGSQRVSTCWLCLYTEGRKGMDYFISSNLVVISLYFLVIFSNFLYTRPRCTVREESIGMPCSIRPTSRIITTSSIFSSCYKMMGLWLNTTSGLDGVEVSEIKMSFLSSVSFPLSLFCSGQNGSEQFVPLWQWSRRS